MEASMALPVAYKLNPCVEINGNYYCDSSFTTNPKHHIEKAFRDGAEKVIVIDNRLESDDVSGMTKKVFDTWTKFKSSEFRTGLQNEIDKAASYKIPKEKIFHIKPISNESFRFKTLDNRRELIHSGFEEGTLAAFNVEREVKNFVNE